MWKSILAIALGSALGALLRWVLGTRFNTLFPVLPPGTLLANLIGGYIIGLAIAFFAHMPDLAPEWRLLIITGFCGGLTTFSTFSAEVLILLQQERWVWAATAIATHVSGSLVMTLAGMLSWHWLKLRLG
ncbi:MAG: fluoride efflux transporter CrcB [Magnetococcales bacterium]|nr:fluoride efflux transporter CrcB [Magnetococcales bacterium]